MFVPAHDEPNYDIALKFIQCADFIDNSVGNGGRVLVHCFAGKSRCCAITMGYLMLRKGMQVRPYILYLHDSQLLSSNSPLLPLTSPVT